MFFKKKPKPLKEAIRLVHQVTGIAWHYKRNKSYQPTEADLKSFHQLAAALREAYSAADHIAHCMEQRARGEPEGTRKLSTNPKMSDYHYPE